jgi:hypothetical protein
LASSVKPVKVRRGELAEKGRSEGGRLSSFNEGIACPELLDVVPHLTLAQTPTLQVIHSLDLLSQDRIRGLIRLTPVPRYWRQCLLNTFKSPPKSTDGATADLGS